MYDAAWYSFEPASNQHQDDQYNKSKNRRRESLLKQPNESTKVDSVRVEGIAEVPERPQPSIGPPQPTLSRRARSYSDFYDVVTAQLRKDRVLEKHQEKGRGKNSPQDELDMAEWISPLDGMLQDATHEKYHTSSALTLLSSLSESFQAVESQTTAFRAQCEGIISSQQQAKKLSIELDENIQYYNYLEPLTRRLNAPSAGNVVGQREFSEMLATLDHCLRYMQSHTTHEEAGTYLARYRLLMTRALTLVRNHFVTSLREISGEVSKRIADRQLNETTMSALLYAKFRVGATKLKAVGKEIQKRAMVSDDVEGSAEVEYQSLMNELYQNYSATRGKLIIPLVRKKIANIASAPSTGKDLVSFSRSSIGYVRGVCFDEFELWREWFEGDDSLYAFLESVCEPLYDHLRPRIIHETQILKLCELCTLLQTRYMHDQDEDAEILEPGQLDFSLLVQPILEDAQTRLVFRAQAILRDEIEQFRPAPTDIEYPPHNRRALLSGTKNNHVAASGRKVSIATPETPLPQTPRIVDEAGDEADGDDPKWGFDTEAAFQGWYPTLRKAIWLLSRIYRLVNSTVFDDLAHQIVHQTTASLHSAAAQISSKAAAIDGQLFLIKHLLILKSQILAFDIEFVTPEISFDFSNVTNTFWDLRQKGGLFNPANLVRLVGGGLVPRVVEDMLDAKVELDGRLRTVITEFTNQAADRMSSNLTHSTFEHKGFSAAKSIASTRSSIEMEVPLLRKKLDEYLDDERTKETLVGAVHEKVMQNFEDFYSAFRRNAHGNGRAGTNGTSLKELSEILNVDAFGEWSTSIFKIRSLSVEDSEEDSRSSSLSRRAST